MTDSDAHLPSAGSNESCDTSHSGSKEEMEVASTVQPYEGGPRASNEYFDEDWQRRFFACGFQIKTRTKTPFTEYLVFFVCVLFSMAKSMLRMSSVFVSIAKTFHSFAISAAKVPSVSALEFRCCRVIPLRNQKRTFDERISCITRHNDFSPRSHRAVSLQVAPFPRECKNRGSRRRAGLTENEWVYSNLIEVNLKEEF